MEGLFSRYPYVLFFLGCFFMLIENRNVKKNINSNIIILYIIFSIDFYVKKLKGLYLLLENIGKV